MDDTRLRELEYRALSGDVEAAKKYLHTCNRLWDRGRSFDYDDLEKLYGSWENPRSEIYNMSQEEIEAKIEQGRNHSFEHLRKALHLLGILIIESFVNNLNHELAKTDIPFNPLGIASTDSVDSAYTPAYWWASLKERYSLEPEMTMHGHMECEPEQYGEIPGFQVNYGIGGEYKLYPDGRKTFKIWDTTTGAKVNEWLGRGDAGEFYRLSQIQGFYGGPGGRPSSWVDQDEYWRRRDMLKQEIVDAVYRADPEIDVIEDTRIYTGGGSRLGKPVIVPPSHSRHYKRRNPSFDEHLRQAERVYSQDPTEENLDKIRRLRQRSGLIHLVDCYWCDEILPANPNNCGICKDPLGGSSIDRWTGQLLVGQLTDGDYDCCESCSMYACDTHGDLCNECRAQCMRCGEPMCEGCAHECETCGKPYCSDECREAHYPNECI
jgi:hypothetical protein